MEVESLKDYLVMNKETLITSNKRGKYHPNPVRRVDIPKENGKKRQLGILTVVDRVIQQNIAQQLSPIYEPVFSGSSFGFRTKREAHLALCKCREYITEGYVYAVDIELERRGHKFVHYADDMVIFCRSRRSAERTMKKIIPFIEGKLFLKVNRDKSYVAHAREIKFLGYSFYIVKGEGRLRIHPRSVAKMKARNKELTSRSNGWGNDRRKEALRQYITGWVQYFKLADMQSLMEMVDEWYRRRLRMVIWKQWKRSKTKIANLVKFGINRYKAYEWANTRKGYWHIANSYILHRSITTEGLRLAGYVFLSDYYRKVRVVN